MSMQNPYGKYIKLSIYLVIIVLINVAGMTLFFRMDLRITSYNVCYTKLLRYGIDPVFGKIHPEKEGHARNIDENSYNFV